MDATMPAASRNDSPCIGGCIDGNPYAKEYVLNTVFLVMTMVMMLCGTFGNVLVIGAVLTHRKLRNLGNAFVVNLAVADFSVSTFVNAFGFLGLLTKGTFFRGRDDLCEVISAVCVISCACSMWSMASIGVNRYVAIVHRHVYHDIYNRRMLPFLLAALWGTCFLVDLPILVGWGRHSFEPKLLMCSWNYLAAHGYTIYLSVTAIFVPLILVGYSNVRIFIYARSTAAEIDAIQKKGEKSQSANQPRPIRKQDLRLLRSVLTIVVVFMIMWSPYAVFVTFDTNGTWSRSLYVVALILAHMNSCINSFIYGATNPSFRQAYARLICAPFRCVRRVVACGKTDHTPRSVAHSFNSITSKI